LFKHYIDCTRGVTYQLNNRLVRCGFICLWLTAGTSQAQLYGNAVPAALLANTQGIVWFGTVRNEQGQFLENATVQLDTGIIEHVAVTGIEGRFRLVLPKNIPFDAVMPYCARPGSHSAHIQRRPPPRGFDSPIELQCVLR